MTQFLQNLINGLSAGSLYAILAVGIVLVYKSSDVLNFAHGTFAMLSTFVAYHISIEMGFGYGWAILAATVFSFALGAITYRVLLERVRKGGSHAVVMVTIGLLMVLEGTAGALWGTDTKEFHHLFAKPSTLILPAGLVLSELDAWIISFAILMALLLAIFFRTTRVGIGLRAVAQNEVAARLMGIQVDRIQTLIWGMATALGSMAGLLIVPKLFLDPAMMFTPLLKAFAAAVLGGMKSVPGAIVGAWMLGIIETLAGAYISTEFQATLAFVIILVVLVVRPEGLFGRHQIKKV